MDPDYLISLHKRTKDNPVMASVTDVKEFNILSERVWTLICVDSQKR